MYTDYKRRQKAKHELKREDSVFDLNIPEDNSSLRRFPASFPLLDSNNSNNHNSNNHNSNNFKSNNKVHDHEDRYDSVGSSWIPIDRSDKSICVSLSDLELLSNYDDIDTHVKLEKCCVSLKNFPEYPWITIQGMSFIKRILPLETKDFFYEDTDIDIPKEASMVSKSKFNAIIESFEVRLSVRMELGAIIDQVSSQMSALSVAISPSPSERPYDTFNPFEFHFVVNSFSVLLDSHYQDDCYIESFMRFECKDIDFSLDSTKHPISIQDQITALDLSNDPLLPNNQHLYIYTNVVGGHLNFFIKAISLRFKPLTEAFLDLEEISFIGPVYSASIADSRIAFEATEVLLFESQPNYFPILNEPFNPTSASHDIKSVKKSPCLKLFSMIEEDLMYAITTKSSAPGKIYLDILVAAHVFEFKAHPVTMQCIEAVSSTISCLSINTDTTPALTTWDSIRYWMHGRFKFSSDQIFINIYAQDYMTQNMKLRFCLDLFKFYVDCNIISTTAENILFDAEITSKLVGTNRRTSTSRKTLSKTNSVHTKLFSIPSFVFSLKHSLIPPIDEKHLSSLDTSHHTLSLYSHHDVYLRPAIIDDAYYFLEEYEKPNGDIINYQDNDKFINFRSKKFSYKWKIEFRIADEKDVPIHFNIRIDHVVCIIDAINFMYVANSNRRTKTSFESVSDQIVYDTLSYYNKNKPKFEILPLSAVDMASIIEVQAEFDKIMVSSWPSGTNHGGFVLEVGNSDLQLRMKRDLTNQNIYYCDHDTAEIPLKVDHFFVETSIVELYVRQWIVKSSSSQEVEDNTKPNDAKRNLNFEKIPNTWFEITKLFQPIYKVAHTTKTVISLTESGEVCIRDPSFVKSGILVKVAEKKHESIYKKLGINPLYISIRVSRKHSTLLSEFSESVFYIGKDWKDQNDGNNLQKNKIKSLFHILKVDKGHILFESSTSPEHITIIHSPLHSSRQRRLSVVSHRRRTVSLIKESPLPPKFTGYRASLQIFKANHSAFAPPSYLLPASYNVTKSGFLKSADQPKQLRSNPDDMQEDSSSYGNKIWGLRVIDLRLLFTIDIRDVIFGYVARCMDLVLAGTNDDRDDTNYPNNNNPTEDSKRRFNSINLKKKPEARASFSDFKNADRFFSSTDYSTDADTNIKNEINNNKNNNNHNNEKNVNLTSSDIINHLLSKTVSDEIDQNNKAAGDRKENSIKNATNNHRLQSNLISKSNTKSVGICFFVVEFLDPQVNFLDVKTHSSLIIVAGLSSLEGRRASHATLPPRNVFNSRNKIRNSIDSIASTALLSSLEPKRQQEVRLRMDGVSAFTVPTIAPSDDTTTECGSSNNLDESSVVDIVHWKHMATTNFTKVPSKKHASLFTRSKGTDESESPYMHMAIKDFQIRAVYKFWTDITVSEAKLMHIENSKQDLVCSFKLELPVIIVDISSWQFYVIMHVVRNVLLVPPPASAKRANLDSEMEQDKQVLEIPRHPDVVAAQKSATLDLHLKNCRDEVKNLIEHNLSDVMLEMELGSARLVECSIGSCTWILRTNISSNSSLENNSTDNLSSEKEQLKVSFTGIHATFFYGEDRFVCNQSFTVHI